MLDILAVFLTGLLTSFHCIGMCGPIIVAYSLHLTKPSSREARINAFLPVLHHLTFHAGRLTTYGAMGGAAGWLADRVLALEVIHISQFTFLRIGGVVMILMGLAIMGILPIPERYISGVFALNKLGGCSISKLIASAGVGKKWLLGLCMGFLPCVPLYAVLVRAMATASFVKGFGLMVSFGLGTLPALLFLGIFASLAGMRARILSRWLMGLSILFMGAFLVHKGLAVR
ncbi:MAG: sulfite exporter TauE/SafE family protein [Deltaproteobacteria bacterium]|nr:sulfite exporter TauE/SafE family protein [Deltaproteobacteria bacterium]